MHFLTKLINNKSITVKPAHNGQIISQEKSTIRSRWPLRATKTYAIFPPNGNLILMSLSFIITSLLRLTD